MSKQCFLIANSKQGMRYASVAYIYLGRLDQPLPDISVPGRQPANNQEIDKKVEIPGDRLAIDSQAPRKIGGIQKLRLVMCQHRPVASKRLSRYAQSELRNVALQVGSYKIAPPLHAEIVGFRQKTAWKTAPDP